MPDESSSWNAIMQYSFLRVFANDGTIDADELAMLQKLALSDGVVDERERRVLQQIFARVSQQSTTPEVWDSICSFKRQFDIP
jgi:uncharacterized membrane protein YebE (DUF533 family)